MGKFSRFVSTETLIQARGKGVYTESWIGPLFLLPGVGLLVMSTAARYSRLHEEMHHFEEHPAIHQSVVVGTLLARARLFRDSLVALYSAAALLSSATLLGALLTNVSGSSSQLAVDGLTTGAIVCVVVACIQLVRESMRSLHVIYEHAQQVDDS